MGVERLKVAVMVAEGRVVVASAEEATAAVERGEARMAAVTTPVAATMAD